MQILYPNIGIVGIGHVIMGIWGWDTSLREINKHFLENTTVGKLLGKWGMLLY